MYDSYGNATQIVVSASDGFTKTTTNTYANDATKLAARPADRGDGDEPKSVGPPRGDAACSNSIASITEMTWRWPRSLGEMAMSVKMFRGSAALLALAIGVSCSGAALAQQSATRTSAFAYDASSGLLTQEVIEPNTTALRLQTDYAYNAFARRRR
jgi:hypothetical protein